MGGTPNDSDRLRELGVWPWSAGVAIALVPVILATLVAAHVVVRSTWHWPDERYGGWVLLGIVVLSVAPVLLLLIELLVVSGGSVKVAGVALSFSGASLAVAATVHSTTLSENLDTPEDAALTQTSLRSVLRALRRAHDSDITIVDLRQGQTWWETRLFILIAGAARTGRPQAIAFVADRNGKHGVFLGWASPTRLLDLYTSSMPEFAIAHDRACAKAAQWRIGTPTPQPGHPPSVLLPWNDAQLALPALDEDTPDPAFAEELFLQDELDRGPAELRRHVTIQRLEELFDAALITDSVDENADDDEWIRLLRSGQRSFFALTSAEVLKTVVPRDALVGALVAQLAASSAGRQRPRGNGPGA